MMTLFLYPVVWKLGHQLVAPTFHAGRQYTYQDTECLLKLVNTTNPEHFAVHPIWSSRGYDSDCDIQEYFQVQQANQIESVILRGHYILSVMTLFYSPPKRIFFTKMLIICAIGLPFLNAHYQHDNVEFCGNLIHHSNLSDDTGNNNTR